MDSPVIVARKELTELGIRPAVPAKNRKKTGSTRFQKGQSGNPTGRPTGVSNKVTREVREFCQGQIAHHKIPRHIRFVDEFPMTVTGKVQKFVMRDQMIERLGLDEAETA